MLRKKLGLTQESLARMTSVSLPTLARWEVGKTEPKISDLISIANALETSVAFLTGEDSDPGRSHHLKGNIYVGPDPTLRRADGTYGLEPDITVNKQEIKGANFTNADLTGANLTRTSLPSSIFTGAVLRNANLTEANLTRCIFQSTDMEKTDQTGTVFDRSIFQTTNMKGAVLRNTSFKRCIIMDVDFEDAVFENVDLSGALVSGTIIDGKIIDGRYKG